MFNDVYIRLIMKWLRIGKKHIEYFNHLLLFSSTAVFSNAIAFHFMSRN
jgi:hypothetical protein